PQKGHAVRRFVELAGSDVRMVMNNMDFQQLGPGSLWLPRKCRIDWHSWPSRPNLFTPPILVETLTVQEVDQKPPPDATFTLRYEAGMHLRDNRPEAAKEFAAGFARYKVPANPEDLEAAIAESLRQQREARQSWFVRHWFLSANLAVLGLFGAVLLFRLCRQYVQKPGAVT